MTINSKFLTCVNKAAAKATDFEVIGDTTEFFDEDGCVVMTARDHGKGKILFEFPESDSAFDLEEIEDNE